MKQIANIFTLCNLFLGLIAIIFIAQPGLTPLYKDLGNGQIVPDLNPEGIQFVSVPEQIYVGSILIGIAGIIDFLDGFVARLLKQTSEIGKQLDSLSDLVSFGVAPALIIYEFLRMSFANQPDGLDTNIIWLIPAFILPCAGAYRLARFNIDSYQSNTFKGMPIPAIGILIASFPLIYWFTNEKWEIDILLNKWFWYGMIALLSWLMVSNLPLMNMKVKDLNIKNNLARYILLILGIIAAISLKWLAVPVIFILYVIISLAFQNKTS